MNVHDSNGRRDNITLEAVLLPAGNASRNTVGVLHCRLFTCLLSVHFFFFPSLSLMRLVVGLDVSDDSLQLCLLERGPSWKVIMEEQNN